ncbi:hypothetical protein F4819DRAFT_483303 [Hypoxylon fuscum]|nr:hypothetical protein F4819DRAFT_483303 [Hypoxylon fuscum]
MFDLQKVLPTEGMMYQDRRDRQDLDPEVLNAMKKAGFVNIKRTASSLQESKQAVDLALAHVFTLALKPSILKKLKAGFTGAARFTVALRYAICWAQSLSKPDWFRFCVCLVAAHQAWSKNPKRPIDPAQWSATAKSIDKFLQKAGGRWVPAGSSSKIPSASNSELANFNMKGVKSALHEAQEAITEEMELDQLEDALFEEKDVGEVQEGIERMQIDPYDPYGDDDTCLDL